MEKLFIKSREKVKLVKTGFIRYLMNEIDWNDRMIGIKGARGVGKTTLLLQIIKTHLQNEKVLYITLEDLYFTENSLYTLAEDFVNHDGRYLVIDEVHRYPDWAKELKLIYDDFNSLRIIFTGSSILDIIQARADLSRRAVVYTMQGLSFREYLNFSKNLNLPKYDLTQILENHLTISDEIIAGINPIPVFAEYLKIGYYPYFIENESTYLYKLSEVVNQVLSTDLTVIKKILPDAIPRIRKLLYVISNSVPFKPNVSKLSEISDISRNTLITYLQYLEEANILNLLHSDSTGTGYLRKPEKIYLENTNLQYAISDKEPESGNLRETFFINQIKKSNHITFSQTGDFKVNEKYFFEIGGKNKTRKQIAGVESSFIAADNIQYGFENKIPLWLFGFLY
ncbi:MAG TPA: AAA family ATPase [Bacteroidales bacterium]|nr:AAA family ATPase [Bacteroidales bacterium]HRX97033.1 AAA family ATPase [Bacteroidales bacterium]